MADTGRGVCDLCNADIVWAVTPAGKRMPLDPARLAEDDARGNIGVRRDHLGRVLARVLSTREPLRAGEWRGIAHFATCPYWRRQRSKEASEAAAVQAIARAEADAAAAARVIPFRHRGRARR